MTASGSDLTPFQREVLEEFFRIESEFYLTGGAALAGFHLHHRETSDLDLFTLDGDAHERARRSLQAIAASLGGTLEVRQSAPGFERAVLSRGDDAVVVDLVHERVVQLVPDKPVIDGVRVDPIPEILANKLTTIVSRAEVRDLVDVYCLERAGHRVDDALEGALRKDGGATPATLAWLLSEVEIPEGVSLPGGVDPAALRAWLSDLIRRLRIAAAPSV